MWFGLSVTRVTYARVKCDWGKVWLVLIVARVLGG